MEFRVFGKCEHGTFLFLPFKMSIVGVWGYLITFFLSQFLFIVALVSFGWAGWFAAIAIGAVAGRACKRYLEAPLLMQHMFKKSLSGRVSLEP